MLLPSGSAVARRHLGGAARSLIRGNYLLSECARKRSSSALGAYSSPLANPGPWKLPNRGHSSSHNEVFDKSLLLRRRGTSFALYGGEGSYDYLRRECAERLVDRLDDISRPFPEALDLGCDTGHVFAAITSRNGPSGETQTGGVQSLVQADAACFLSPPPRPAAAAPGDSWSENGVSTRFHAIDDESLDLSPNSYDLILSSLHLHWVNHLPGLLDRVKRALRPDGAFIGCMLGGSTLQELRHCFFLAEQERRGGVSPHCSPFARPSDVSALMQGAGFALPTIDVDTITVSYPDMFTLAEHLEGMGSRMAAHSRRLHVGRDCFLAAAAAYQNLYSDGEGGIKATFQVINFIGWAPHASQPQPKARGSASVSLKDVL